MKPEAAPRVSVIIVFRNEERFLAEAVESVWLQDAQQFEIVLVDDGSTDGSAAVAHALAERDPRRLRYLTHPRGQCLGISASRNLGLAHARGELIAFLDADDVWLSEKLSAQMAILDAHPEAAMVYGRTLIWHSWRVEPRETDYCYDLGLAPDRVIPPLEPLRVMINNKAQTPTTCNAMIRKQAITQVGGLESKFRGMFEDQVLFAKIMASHPIYVSSALWARYRQRADSVSAKVSAYSEAVARRRFLGWLRAYLRAQRIFDGRLSSLLRRERIAADKRLLKAAVRHALGA